MTKILQKLLNNNLMLFKKKIKKEIPHCNVKIKDNKPFIYSMVYDILFSTLHFIIIVDQLQGPREHSDL